MSDEKTDDGRDASAPTDPPRSEQPDVPSYAAAGAPVGGGPGSGSGYPGPRPQAGPSWSSGPPHNGNSPYGPDPLASTVVNRPPATGRPKRVMTGIVAAALIAGVVGGGAGFGGAYALLGSPSGGGTQLTSAPPGSGALAVAPGSVTAAVDTALPSTVDIRVTLAQGTAEGSGVILTADGNVLTNNHVIAGAQNGGITVTLADGSTHQATVVGTSPSYDLAVIKIQNVSGLTPATLGRSQDLQVGQTVVAIGSPQGLTDTVTSGIISAFNRTVTAASANGSGAVVYNGLQTDAPINPGNSGGPLVNLAGQVIGINSAIATGGGQSNGSVGLGFAIPVNQAQRVAQELMTTGTATKPVLGVTGSVSATGSTGTTGGIGAQIATVQPGSPAAAAGLATGDTITKVGSDTVQNFADLIARIGSYAPGQQVSLTLNSGGSTRTVPVTLGSQPDTAASTSTGGQNANPFGGGGG